MTNIRKYNKGDEIGIISLFNEVFDATREKDYWDWQFMDNPIAEPIIVVADDNSKIVGQCTLLPTNIWMNNEGVLAGQSIDTMISKDYRGKGIYKEMAEKSYKLGVENGIKVRIGFPSEMAIKGLLDNMGGTLVTNIPLFMNIYRLDKFLKVIVKSEILSKILGVPGLLIVKLINREKRIKINQDYIFKDINEFNEDFDKLWDKIKLDSEIMSIRDSGFLNWRIKNHPNNNYKTIGAYLDDELAGYIVLKLENKIVKKTSKLKLGSIVDIIGIDEDVMAALYYESKKYFKKEKTDFVVTWLTDNIGIKGLFTKLGFQKSKSNIPFVVKSLVKDLELEQLIAKEENWYLMPIESDFY